MSERIKPTYVYRLRCPMSQKVRYIGISKHLSQRLCNHRSTWWTSEAMTKWIDELESQGLKPLLEKISPPMSRRDAGIAESRLIFLFSTMYPRQLFNQSMRIRRLEKRKQGKIDGPQAFVLSRIRENQVSWLDRLERMRIRREKISC